MKNKIIKLECGCKFHQIIIEKFEDTLFICIYEHKSMNTGKLLKKPKLLGDVVLYPEEMKILKEYLKNE